VVVIFLENAMEIKNISHRLNIKMGIVLFVSGMYLFWIFKTEVIGKVGHIIQVLCIRTESWVDHVKITDICFYIEEVELSFTHACYR
jgi:hypothetical protein